MEKFVDVVDWPAVGQVRLTKGRLANEQNSKFIFEARRFADPRKGRFFYDLYLEGELYLPHVNPLFLEFVK